MSSYDAFKLKMLSFLEDEEDSHLYVDGDPESVVLSFFLFFLFF